MMLIVETRPDITFDQANDEDGMLPLHSLCLNDSGKGEESSLELLHIIEYVVNIYPGAVRVRNRRGFIPLHYATRSTLEITKILVEQYPESVSIPAYRLGEERTTFQGACVSGSIDTIKYL